MVSLRAISAAKELEREKDVHIGNITCNEIKLRMCAYEEETNFPFDSNKCPARVPQPVKDEARTRSSMS